MTSERSESATRARIARLPQRSGAYIRLCLLLAVVGANTSTAQTGPPLPGGLQKPVDEPLPPPTFEKPAPVDLPAPRLPPISPDDMPAGMRVFVNKIEIRGNTAFPDRELANIAAPYEGRQITSEELEQLRHDLTLYYVDRGYINSGAVIPDQDVNAGMVRIDIVEGRLTDILVDGTDRLQPGFVADRLALGGGPPLNINELQQQLQIVLHNPRVQRINAQLHPGDRPGEARLKAEVTEGSPQTLGLVVDNRLSPSVGPARGRLQGRIHNITGWGDTLALELGHAKGLEEYYAGYSAPLNARDTTVRLWVDKDDSVVVEEPFDALNIESETKTLGVELTHPFVFTPQRRLTLGLGLEHRKSRTSLLGRGFNFSPGVEDDGESKVTVARFRQEWLDRSREQVIAARSTLSLGLGLFDSTVHGGSLPDSKFVAWLGQFQWTRRLFEDHQILLRADAQVSNSRLLGLEQFAVGGMNSVRGYRSNELVRDRGFSASLEYRVPLLRNEAGLGVLQLAAFADAGGAWNKGGSTPNPKTIHSLGVGLLWDPHPKVHAELYWGKALRHIDHVNHDLQDSGIHFQLNVNAF